MISFFLRVGVSFSFSRVSHTSHNKLRERDSSFGGRIPFTHSLKGSSQYSTYSCTSLGAELDFTRILGERTRDAAAVAQAIVVWRQSMEWSKFRAEHHTHYGCPDTSEPVVCAEKYTALRNKTQSLCFREKKQGGSSWRMMMQYIKLLR